MSIPSRKDSQELHEAIYSAIVSWFGEHGSSPTDNEIAGEVEASLEKRPSKGTVHRHLEKLCREDRIEWIPRKHRSIKLKDIMSSLNMVDVHIVSLVGAHSPIPTEESDVLASEDEIVHIPRRLVGGSKGLFALEVTGTSMINALIYEDDIVILDKYKEPKDGDIAAIYLNKSHETTLKRIFKKEGTLKLKPENSKQMPFDVKDVEIQGIAVCVIHKL